MAGDVESGSRWRNRWETRRCGIVDCDHCARQCIPILVEAHSETGAARRHSRSEDDTPISSYHRRLIGGAGHGRRIVAAGRKHDRGAHDCENTESPHCITPLADGSRLMAKTNVRSIQGRFDDLVTRMPG